jgi:hypothetical protein
LVSKDRRHLFVTRCLSLTLSASYAAGNRKTLAYST